MDIFYGFDLGDAESAVSRLEKKDQAVPEVLSVREARSFITAYAQMQDGELLIGESACYAPGAAKRKIRFKSNYLKSAESRKDIKTFAAGVLGELYGSGDLVKASDSCFYIGCPAGWDKGAREDYREIFESVGYPPLRIISESRAALVAACQSKHLQIGYDINSKSVLVVDIGSSTTDFAHIQGGHEVELHTAGEVALGGGIMDEILLEEAVSASPSEGRIRSVFEKSEAWKNYCEFAARRLKEKYFSDEEYWKDKDCRQLVTISYKLPIRLTLRMNGEIADALVNKRIERLGGRSFREVFVESLKNVRENMGTSQPDLVFLTGGVSKLPAVKKWCQETFPDAVIISGAEPEFSVSRGLAWCGKIDEEVREFRQEVNQMIESNVVENIVQRKIENLYRRAVDAMVDPILQHVALPVFDRWRSGEIERLNEVNGVLEEEIEAYLRSEDARTILSQTVSAWLKPVADDLEDYTVPLCIRHHVPYQTMSLTSYLKVSDIGISLDAKNVFAMEELTWLIDTIITLLVGFLCGGNGVALVAGGLPGIMAGILVSMAVLILGKKPMQKAVMNARIPVPARKIVPRRFFESRLGQMSSEIQQNFYKDLEQNKNKEITDRMVEDISGQIEQCLSKMAEVVEVPLEQR